MPALHLAHGTGYPEALYDVVSALLTFRVCFENKTEGSEENHYLSPSPFIIALQMTVSHGKVGAVNSQLGSSI